MKKAFGILVSLILWTPLLFAQVKFTATASKTNVAVGEQFEIDFFINSNCDRFTPPDLSPFQILSGPNISTSKTFNNGTNADTAFKITYSFILVSTKEGTFNVGAATVVVNGHKLLSNALKIDVKGQFPAGQQQQVDIPTPVIVEDSSKTDTVDIKALAKQIFITAEANKTHAYVGEKIKVTYKLYTRVNIASGQVEKAPALTGFREQKVPNPGGQKNAWTTENVNGLKYSVVILKQSVLFPEHTGNLTISPLNMAAVLQIPEKEGTVNNPIEYYKKYKYEVKSAPVVIHVVALPSKSAKTGIKG